jgi:hypothetical protein
VAVTQIRKLQEEARDGLHEKDKLRHIADPVNRYAVWTGVEDKMVKGLRDKKRNELQNGNKTFNGEKP